MEDSYNNIYLVVSELTSNNPEQIDQVMSLVDDRDELHRELHIEHLKNIEIHHESLLRESLIETQRLNREQTELEIQLESHRLKSNIQQEKSAKRESDLINELKRSRQELESQNKIMRVRQYLNKVLGRIISSLPTKYTDLITTLTIDDSKRLAQKLDFKTSPKVYGNQSVKYSLLVCNNDIPGSIPIAKMYLNTNAIFHPVTKPITLVRESIQNLQQLQEDWLLKYGITSEALSDLMKLTITYPTC